MTDLKPAILSLLSPLPAAVLPAFPAQEAPLPIITVADEASSVLAQADGEAYLEEHVFSLQILAADRPGLEALVLAADAALSTLGLRRTGCRDQFDETARAYQKTLSYRAVVHGDTVYSS